MTLAVDSQGVARPRSRRRRRVSWLPYVFVAAAVAYLLLLTALPVLDGIWLGFTNTTLLDPTGGSYVGLDNYKDLFSGHAGIGHSLVVTCVYTALVVIASLVIGVGAAILINRPFPGRLLGRVLLTLPWAVPTVAASLIFIWILNKDSGVLNYATGHAGLGVHGWLTDAKFGMFSVVLASVWMVFPFVMLVVMAALQSIPEEMYEAARVDGADAFNVMKNVTLPYLYPTIRVVALLMTIWSFRRFEVVWLMTQGGPVDATNVLVVNVYRQAFRFNQLGMSAAIGVLGVLLSLVVTVIFFALERRASPREVR